MDRFSGSSIPVIMFARCFLGCFNDARMDFTNGSGTSWPAAPSKHVCGWSGDLYVDAKARILHKSKRRSMTQALIVRSEHPHLTKSCDPSTNIFTLRKYSLLSTKHMNYVHIYIRSPISAKSRSLKTIGETRGFYKLTLTIS